MKISNYPKSKWKLNHLNSGSIHLQKTEDLVQNISDDFDHNRPRTLASRKNLSTRPQTTFPCLSVWNEKTKKPDFNGKRTFVLTDHMQDTDGHGLFMSTDLNTNLTSSTYETKTLQTHINAPTKQKLTSKRDYLNCLDIKHKDPKMKELKSKVIKLVKNKVIINLEKAIADSRKVEKQIEYVLEKKFVRRFSSVDDRQKIGIYINKHPELINDNNIYFSGFEDKFHTPLELILNNFTAEEIELLRNNRRFFNLENKIFDLEMLNGRTLTQALNDEDNVRAAGKDKKHINLNPFKKLKSQLGKAKNCFSYGNLEKHYIKIPEKKQTQLKSDYKAFKDEKPMLETKNIYYHDDFSFDNEEDKSRLDTLNMLFGHKK